MSRWTRCPGSGRGTPGKAGQCFLQLWHPCWKGTPWPGWDLQTTEKGGKKRIILVLSNRDIVGLREILSSDHLGWSLNQKVNYSIVGFIISVVVALKRIINPPESSSSHHPDEEGGKKRLEKSAADLKGSTKTFYQRSSYLNILTLKSCFALICCSLWLSKNCSVVPKLNLKSPKLE